MVVLEFVEFKWTISQVLDQDEQLLEAVMYLKSLGSKMRNQARAQTEEG